jgi:four helix bundle protein
VVLPGNKIAGVINMETGRWDKGMDAGLDDGSGSRRGDSNLPFKHPASFPASTPKAHLQASINKKPPIRSYRDLEVYQITYMAAIDIIRKVLPKLPKEERFDLVDQLRRSSKAIPRLIAEGYAKKHQLKGFHKYLDDAMAEVNETAVSLSQCRDAYPGHVDPTLCDQLLVIYDRAGKQLYRLREVWRDFRDRK